MLSAEFIRKSEVSGRPAEVLATKLLTDRGWQVQDMHDNPEYYHKGDLLISKNNKTYNLDVKNDYQIGLYGNFCFEVGINRNNGKGEVDGWGKKASYDFLAFNNSKDNIMYILDYKMFKDNIDKLYHKETNFWNKNEKAYLHCKLVKVQKCIDAEIMVAEIHYDNDNNITDYVSY